VSVAGFVRLDLPSICCHSGSVFLEGRPVRVHAEDWASGDLLTMPTIECPNCFAKLDAPAEYKGRTVKCKDCGKSFVLRFTGRNKPSALKFSDRAPSSETSTVSFRLSDISEAAAASSAGSPGKRAERPTKSATEKVGQPVSITVEPGRAALYQRVAAERFKGDLSAFARTALDALAEKLGYPLKPS
jgi:hypothetical protein